VDWYRTPIDRDLLNELMQRNNFRGWLQTLAHLGWFAATAGFAWFAFTLISVQNWFWSVPLTVLALFVHGTMGPFMGLIAIHELQHRTVFKSRALNAFFEKLYAFISWSDYLWYQQSHVRHHQVTCQRGHDGEVVLPVKFSLRRWRFWLGLLAWNPQTTRLKLQQVWNHARGRIHGAWYQHVLPESDQQLRRQHRNWARMLLLGHGSLALIFILSGHWFLIVVFTLGTQYCSWLGFLCGVPQHFGLNSDMADFRLNTRTFTCSWLPAFYYWNMQYHLEHHMYPAVPFYNLGKLRAALIDDLPPATHGLRATWKELLEIRERARSNPDYHYLPKLPESEPDTRETGESGAPRAVSV
jgi:fatty acid desaturase